MIADTKMALANHQVSVGGGAVSPRSSHGPRALWLVAPGGSGSTADDFAVLLVWPYEVHGDHTKKVHRDTCDKFPSHFY